MDRKCAKCGVDNPAEAKFCGQCAAPMALTCAACGHANLPSSRFCNQCAAALGDAAEHDGGHAELGPH